MQSKETNETSLYLLLKEDEEIGTGVKRITVGCGMA